MKFPLVVTCCLAMLTAVPHQAAAIVGRFDLPQISPREAGKISVTVLDRDGPPLGPALVASLVNYSEESSTVAPPAPSLIPTCEELVGLYNVSGSKGYDTCGTTDTEYAQMSQINCVAGSVTMVIIRWGDGMTGAYDEDNGSNSANAALSFEGTAQKTSAETSSSITIQGNLGFVQQDGCQTIYEVTYSK